MNAGQGTLASPPAAGAGARTIGGLAGQAGWDSSWNSSLTADTPALVAALACHATLASWTDAPARERTMPINCITWFEAWAFCVWDGELLADRRRMELRRVGRG